MRVNDPSVPHLSICPSIQTSAHPFIHRYDGVACQRTTCPLNCLGRGVCFTEKHFAQKAGRTYDLAWDAYKQVSVCVGGPRRETCCNGTIAGN